MNKLKLLYIYDCENGGKLMPAKPSRTDRRNNDARRSIMLQGKLHSKSVTLERSELTLQLIWRLHN